MGATGHAPVTTASGAAAITIPSVQGMIITTDSGIAIITACPALVSKSKTDAPLGSAVRLSIHSLGIACLWCRSGKTANSNRRTLFNVFTVLWICAGTQITSLVIAGSTIASASRNNGSVIGKGDAREPGHGR